MIPALATLLVFQLVGEALVRTLAVPVPGPVVGMAGLLITLVYKPAWLAALKPTTATLLQHLSLLFVPAGAGVVGHLATLGDSTLAILLAIVVSAVLAIAAGALTFAGVARLTGSSDD